MFSFYLYAALYVLFFLGVVVFGIVLLRNLRVIGDNIAGLREKLPPAAPPNGQDGMSFENLRLQACERFTLMLERISLPNLLLRQPPSPETPPREYTAELLLAIRQEVEYNITQQVYVSDSLWRIITQSRDNVSMLIARASENAHSSRQVAERLRRMSAQQAEDPIALAQGAIRREAASVLTT